MSTAVDLEKLEHHPSDRSDQEDPRHSVDSDGEGIESDRDAEKSDHSPEAEQDLGGPSQRQNDVSTRAHSLASSARSRPLSIVPRSKRRGLFGRFSIIPEVDRPYDYQNKTKWTITLIVALAAAASPMGSAIFFPALPQMAIDLNASPTVTNLSIALYMLAMSIFPLWWSSFSETLGRRTIYLVSFVLFVLFSILSAVSTTVAMLIVMRLFGGGASASVQAVGAGTIADIWEPHERGRAMGIFYLGPLMGPLLAPILGGALSQRFGWASTMWALVIWGGAITVMIFFCLPETLPRSNQAALRVPENDANDRPGLARARTTESVKVHTKRLASAVKHFLVDPLSVLLYIRFGPVLVTVYYSAVTFGSLFALQISVQSAFSNVPYDFSQTIVGLLYLPGAVGFIGSSVLGGMWIDKIMAREARKAGRYDANGKLILLPEDRMRENAWIAGTVYPASLIYYGWTVQKGLPWPVPSIGLFTFGVSSMLVFACSTTMLTEFMPKRSSGGVAVNNFVRNIFSCIGAVAAQPVINAIGHGWMFTIIGLVTWITGYICIWLLQKRGPEWRKTMDKALNG